MRAIWERKDSLGFLVNLTEESTVVVKNNRINDPDLKISTARDS
jgi:hypothetical protein